MTDYIGGKRPVLESFRSGMPLKTVFLAHGMRHDVLIDEICRSAELAGVPVKTMNKRSLDVLSQVGNHQGVIAEASPFTHVPLSDLLSRVGSPALFLILDHITDAGNLGAIIRSANSVGAAAVIIPNRRSAQVTSATYKSSAGAVAHVPVARVANISHTLETLKDNGFWTVAATEHAEELLWDVDLTGRIALVLGNEAEGISRLVLEHCDLQAALPQVGAVASLNVAQAATVFLYEWLRQNRG